MKPFYDHAGITIYCGDSRQILPLIKPTPALVLTDPPYSPQTHKNIKRRSYEKPGMVVDFDSTNPGAIRAILELTGVTGWIVSTMDWRHIAALEIEPPEGIEFVRFGVWVKPNGVPQMTGDRPAQGWEGIAIMHRATGGKKYGWNGNGRRAVWTHNIIPGPHPTMKPLSLFSELMALFSNEGDLVLDPWVGSGTTLLAAKRLGRTAIGIDISEENCNMAVERLAQDSLF